MRVSFILLLLMLGHPAFACDITGFQPEDQMAVPWRGHSLRFKGGVANAYLSPEQESNKTAEFQFVAKRQPLLEVTPGAPVRLVLIEGNHLQGTGTSYLLVGYQCQSGRLKRMFYFQSEYFELKLLSPRSFEVIAAEWKKADAHCCPSLERHEQYVWSSVSRTFVKRRNWLEATKTK